MRHDIVGRGCRYACCGAKGIVYGKPKNQGINKQKMPRNLRNLAEDGRMGWSIVIWIHRSAWARSSEVCVCSTHTGWHRSRKRLRKRVLSLGGSLGPQQQCLNPGLWLRKPPGVNVGGGKPTCLDLPFLLRQPLASCCALSVVQDSWQEGTPHADSDKC
eukprot:4734730-Amphidinium_carterae.1